MNHWIDMKMTVSDNDAKVEMSGDEDGLHTVKLALFCDNKPAEFVYLSPAMARSVAAALIKVAEAEEDEDRRENQRDLRAHDA